MPGATMSEPTVTEQMRPLLERPDPISLKQLSPLTLLDRMDTKFIINTEQLREVLAASIDQYKILEINVFTPGGLNSMLALYGVDFSESVIAALEAKVTQRDAYAGAIANRILATL